MHRLQAEGSDGERSRAAQRSWRRLAPYFACAGVLGSYLLGAKGLDMLIAGAAGALVAMLVDAA